MLDYRNLRVGMVVAGMAVTSATVATGQDQDAVLPMDEAPTLQGLFVGVEGHDASGSYRMVELEGSWQVMLGEDFRSDRVPDAYIVLAQQPDAITSESVFVTKLDKNDGAQTYALPEGIDPASFQYVLIWCKKYAVGIGAAGIEEGT